MKWRHIDQCFWVVGYVYTIWWLLCFVAALAGFQGQVSPPPPPPGVRLRREGVTALHPVVLLPGILSGGLELWEGRPCAQPLFRKPLWPPTLSQFLQRPLCYLEHLSLHNETGMDPPGIRVRAVPGLVAADNFAHAYSFWSLLIQNLAKLGYEGKNLYMASYDWRLSFQNTEIRDQSLSRLKSKIELLFSTNGYKKVVVVPQSMGAVYFLHFLKWVETPRDMGGGGGGPGWCDKHIKAVMNISPSFLGSPRAVSNIFSAEGNDVPFVRALASGLLNFDYFGRRSLENIMQVCQTWDSIISLMPKGGETIWGDLDWSHEEGNNCDPVNKRYEEQFINNNTYNGSDDKQKKPIKYQRIISFGKAFDQIKNNNVFAHQQEIASPKTMERAKAHFSHGIAENIDDPKYSHHRYWSNPLETQLPNAPDMEIYCLYGVGIPTKRSYVYNKLSTSKKCKTIPFRIDASANGGDGVHFVDDDESVPVLSSGFMCAKGWRGSTRFNPSGMTTYIREYRHKEPPGSVLEGNIIMGNVALVEDVLRVAAGATGEDIGGDRIFSDIMRMSERINLRL
ncbi:hypothetical protein PIB30_023091 [Stylosanthes scabra]|uniref:Phospholipid:diacylglycerol acyltransferase 2 n=1 Tax=Stylosanthes scabra TaxID=79078 RepID=A0ABU6Y9T6_9FABA|nr:hypothetical protein [Stylosanthes scabra]